MKFLIEFTKGELDFLRRACDDIGVRPFVYEVEAKEAKAMLWLSVTRKLDEAKPTHIGNSRAISNGR